MALTWRKILPILLVMAAGFASAETKILTLDDCIQMALKYNPDVIQARNQVKIANGAVWQAFGQFLPSVSASISGNQTNTEPGTRLVGNFIVHTSGISKNYSIGGSAGITLFNGGQNIFNYLGSKADKAYFEYLSEQSEQNLILSVKTTYFAYLAALALQKSSAEAVKSGAEQVKLATSKFEVGSAAKSDVLKAQVQDGQNKLALLSAENNIKVTRANLAYLIGADVNSDIDFSPDYQRKEYQGDEASALQYGLQHQPGLLAGQKNLDVAKYDLKSTWGLFSPSLDFRVSRGWNNEFWSEVTKFQKADASTSISATLNIPIFENFSRTASLARSKANLNSTQANYYYLKNNVAVQVKTAFLGINTSKEALKVADESEAAAKEDLALVQEKYNLGAATILELTDAQVSLLTAQSSKIQADFDFNLAVAKLENAIGMR